MSLSAYALGALEGPERDEVARHVEVCPTCRAELLEISRLPGLLDLAGPAELAPAVPPPLLEASVLAALPRPVRRDHLGRGRVGRGRVGRDRWLARARGSAALGLAAATGAAVVLAVTGLTGPGARVSSSARLTLAPTSVAPAARATAVLTTRPWGTQIELLADNLRPTAGSQVYEVWLVSASGRLSAGTFTVSRAHRHITVTLAAGAHPGQYRSIGVTLQPSRNDLVQHGPRVLGAALPS